MHQVTYGVPVSRVRTTVTIDATVLRAVKVAAARTGRGDSEVFEEAVRKGMGLDIFGEVWAQNADLAEGDAIALALEAQQAVRRSD